MLESLAFRLETTFAFLQEELGFKIVDEMTDSYGGRGCVVLESTVLRVRIVDDREDIRAELASPSSPDEWYEVFILKEFVEDRVEKKRVPSIEERASWLRENHDLLRDMLQGEQLERTRRDLAIFGEKRVRVLFGDQWANSVIERRREREAGRNRGGGFGAGERGRLEEIRAFLKSRGQNLGTDHWDHSDT